MSEGTHWHVLLQARPGQAATMHRAVAAVPGVGHVDTTAGPYDAIAEVSVAEGMPVGPTLALLREADGVALVRTCEHRDVVPA